MVLRNVNSGAFEVYDIANNQLTTAASMGTVGTDWQVDGIAADPPTSGASAAPASAFGPTAELVQGMASMSAGSSSVSTLAGSTIRGEIISPTLLTTSQHA